MTALRRLRAACERRLDGLDIPQPFNLEKFCDAVAERRGRPLYLHDLPFPASPEHAYGLYIGTDDSDHVFLEAQTSGWHRDLIGCHEIAHLLLDHHGAPEDLADDVFPDLGPALIRRMLSRQVYDTDDERQAEVLASMILDRAARLPSSHHAGNGTPTGRLSDVLADPRGVTSHD
ncbi:hypothetical protein [Actinoplanes regularis]|uniref:IrrE N-terminal-like domain-containing protein n=1 Tax=Actinoplanes regularis TaxID=52697 RepID=A0A238XIR5_9ACTN|nr:hypothetical protein [Actinoplanes regularis]GIE86825.1 hypothetical protein Are01nite_33050 [Actinoplanes regularis]SNR58214.1 hypothetical protein SAMN06264365_103451 [Actinoplanes regularis]